MEILRKVDVNDFFKVVGIFSSVAIGNVLLYKGLKKLSRNSNSPYNSKENLKDEETNSNCFLEKGEKIVHDATLFGIGVGVVTSVYSAYNNHNTELYNWNQE